MIAFVTGCCSISLPEKMSSWDSVDDWMVGILCIIFAFDRIFAMLGFSSNTMQSTINFML